MNNLAEDTRLNRKAMIDRLLKKQGLLSAKPQISPREREGNKFPLSFSQQRLWFLNQLQPNTATFNVPFFRFLKGPLNVHVLHETLNEIIRRHESLRTSFAMDAEQPVQVIHPFASLELPLDELPESPDEEKTEQLSQICTREYQRPFDLRCAPLLRARLIRTSHEEHVLVLVTHHIVFDGWSFGILSRELAAIYPAFLRGEPSPVPSPSLQYADFAHWQHSHLQGEVLEAQLRYWKQQLAGAPPVVEIPTDYPRPMMLSTQAALQTFGVPRSLTDDLKALARSEGASLYMTLLAAFSVLLYRYSGQEEIVVGSPISNRIYAGTENVIGCFINTLVLNTRYTGEPTFREALRLVRKVSLGACAHQDMPFEKLVEELRPARDLNHHPLFQIMLAFQTEQPASMEFGGVAMSPLPFDITFTNLDLALSLIEKSDHLAGKWIYSRDLFEAETIKQLSRHFHNLLDSIVADPDQRISRLSILSEEERHELLSQSNATRTDYGDGKYVHQLFEKQVDHTPADVAIHFADDQLTYSELNARSNQLAHYLRRIGVGPEVVVGICMERSIEMIVSLLAILKAGGAYLPLDPTYPVERLQFMLEDAGARVLLAGRELIDRIDVDAAMVMCVKEEWEQVNQESEENLSVEISGDNLAYVIYTSGSTGTPKGVQVSHQALVNVLSSVRQAPGLDKHDKLAAIATLCFDIAALELLLPLITGARVVLLDRFEAINGELLADRLEQCDVTVLQGTPATWRLLLASGWKPSNKLKMLCTGEALDPELAQQLAANGTRLWNLYGPTETTLYSSVAEIREAARSISIGKPVANTRIYLLDKHLQLVPNCVAAELYIGGTGVARGYMGAAALTAEKFIPDPFSDQPGARMYRTGDLASSSLAGELRYLGRMDHQVKLRGYRIELGEIEARLAELPSVAQAVVSLSEDTAGDKRLVAYVVPEKGYSPSEDECRSFLRKNLPEYMLPSFVVVLECLPLTNSGKINRRALPAPDLKLLETQKDYVAPRNLVEEMLAGIWANVLGRERVSVESNFFDLGGHSLLAIKLISQIRRTFQIEIPLRHLFEAPTIAQTARAIEDYRNAYLENEEREKILAMVEALSEDQVRELLASKTLSAVGG